MIQQQKLFREISDDEKREWINGERSPFSKFIGNEKALVKVKSAAFAALGEHNHMMRDLAFAFLGPSSAGKTTLGRLYAEVVQLPFLEVSPKSVKEVDDLFKKIKDKLEESGLPLVEMVKNHYVLPPMVILIDEVHALTDSVVQGLLKATEFKDCMMVTESGKSVNTYCVTWMIATTDAGRLFDAFRNRFSFVNLRLLNKKEVAKIVKGDNPDLSEGVCDLIAHYKSRIPRKTLEFARIARQRKGYEKIGWEDAVRIAAADEGIDEYGMDEVHLKILIALKDQPVARNRIGLIAGSKDEEVQNYILPWLMTDTEDQKAFVNVSSRGYVITEAGKNELLKRNIL